MADKSIESLRDTEQRVKRALELRGLPEFLLGKTVVPVVLVQDASGPGWRAQVERSFAYAETVAGGGAVIAHFAIKASSRPAAIDRVWVSMSLSTGVRLGILGPTVADPWAIAQINTRWIERQQGSDELSPMLTAPQNADALPYGQAIWMDALGTLVREIDTTGLVLEPGGKLIVADVTNSGANMTVAFKGRLL